VSGRNPFGFEYPFSGLVQADFGHRNVGVRMNAFYERVFLVRERLKFRVDVEKRQCEAARQGAEGFLVSSLAMPCGDGARPFSEGIVAAMKKTLSRLNESMVKNSISLAPFVGSNLAGGNTQRRIAAAERSAMFRGRETRNVADHCEPDEGRCDADTGNSFYKGKKVFTGNWSTGMNEAYGFRVLNGSFLENVSAIAMVVEGVKMIE